MFDIDRWQEIWITITHNKSVVCSPPLASFGMLMLVLMVVRQCAGERHDPRLKGLPPTPVFSNHNRLRLKGFRKGRRWNITNSDLPVIREKVPELQYLTCTFAWGQDKNVVRGKNGSYR